MTIASNFPAIKPSLMLDFANTKRLDPRVTFTRATTGTYYDGVTTAKAEENLFQYSQEFDNAYWTKANTTITANDTAAPDGTTTADKAEQTSTSNPHIRREMTVSGQYQFSIFVKYIDIQWVRVLIGNFSVWFDVQNGVVGTAESGRTGTIQASTNGFYRLIVDATGLSGSTFFYVIGADGDASIAEALGSYYLWGAQLEQRSAVTSYTATTTQPITNYIPVLLTAASGVPRFDHNPTTDESLGLLIEEQRTNELTYSEDFADASWTKTRSTIESNTIVAPDGTLTGDKLIDTTDNNTHIVSKSITTTAVARTFSVFAKQGGRSYLTMTITDSGNTARTTYFDLSTGAVGTTGTGITASIVNVGNGWYRCIVTIAIAYAGTNPHTLGTATADNTNSYAGNGYDGVFIWGAQAE